MLILPLHLCCTIGATRVREGHISSVAESVAPVARAESAPPLVVESLVKRFGQVTAVDGISLELRPGECFGLLGPNGAGKSTLIRAIAGRVIPDSGRVAVFGSAAGSSAARAALGWVPQDLALYPRLSAKENLRAFGRYNGIAGRKLDESVAWCLSWAALEDRANHLTRTLSGGMKRRLNMAAGLIHHPRLVLLDEPTVGVDPQSRNRIFEMIEALRAQGMTVIYTTHYMEEAERLCDRIAIVDHGKIIALGTAEELVRDAFASRSEVTVRFAAPGDGLEAWTRERGGRIDGDTAQFTVEHAAEIGALLEAAARAGFEVADLSLRKPNLESVFLHLTGKELRD
jgi:ABC-2 type transport system ATP-binding protein